MSNQKEKIVNLNEDSKSHEHDTTSFDRLAKQQEEQLKKLNEEKK